MKHAIAVLVLLGATVSAAAQTPVTSQGQLADLAAKHPQEIVRAQTYFSHTMPIDNLSRRVASWDNVQVRGFRFAAPQEGGMSGGYSMTPGQTVEEAITAQLEGHQAFLEILRKEGNEKLAKEVDEARNRVVAVDVVGTAQAVAALVASERDLRVEDPHNPPPPPGPRASLTEPEVVSGCTSIRDKDCASPFEAPVKN